MSSDHDSLTPPVSSPSNEDLQAFASGLANKNVIVVRSAELAAALLSVGVPLVKESPTFHLKTTKINTLTFHFEAATSDGRELTKDLIEAFTKDMEFIKANPQHPFTFALAAIKNLDAVRSFVRSSVPMVALKQEGSKATLYVKEGSRKYRAAMARGYRHA